MTNKSIIWDRSIRECMNEYQSTMSDSRIKDNICDICGQDMDDIRYCIIIDYDDCPEQVIVWCCTTCYLALVELLEQLCIEFISYYLN